MAFCPSPKRTLCVPLSPSDSPHYLIFRRPAWWTMICLWMNNRPRTALYCCASVWSPIARPAIRTWGVRISAFYSRGKSTTCRPIDFLPNHSQPEEFSPKLIKMLKIFSILKCNLINPPQWRWRKKTFGAEGAIEFNFPSLAHLHEKIC